MNRPAPDPPDRRLRRALGRRLARLRQERDLSQKTIAGALGTTQEVVSRYERGLYAPKLLALLRLRQFFAVSLDCLVAGEAQGEIADWRLRKAALAADALPYDHRTLVVTAFQALVDAARRDAERSRPPGSEA